MEELCFERDQAYMQQVGTVNKNEQKGTENRTLRKTEGDGLRISVENERA